MKSTIINMAERMKDSEDLRLESLFASDAIADNGFSNRVMKRLRRQIWVRRLALPIAFIVGAAIAFKPVVGLVSALGSLISVMPESLAAESTLIPANLVPAGSTVMLGVMAVAVVTMIGKMLEE